MGVLLIILKHLIPTLQAIEKDVKEYIKQVEEDLRALPPQEKHLYSSKGDRVAE